MTTQTDDPQKADPQPTPEAAPAAMSSRAVLGLRNFRLLWIAQAISDLGDGLTNLALLLLVNALTGSTAALAVMAIVLAVPPMTIGLIAGVYVDRLDRRRIMLASDLLRVAIVLGFVFVRSADQVWILFVLGFVEATVGTFFTPARMALVPTIVPREGLLAANGLSQASRIIAMTVGAGAAGVLFGLAGSAWPAFVGDSLTFLISFLLVAQVRASGKAAARPAAQPAGQPGDAGGPGMRAELAEGLAIIARSPVLVGTLVSVGVLMLGIGAVNVLFIPLLINNLHVPTTWVGLVEVAQTSSMILSAVLVTAIARRLKPTSIVTIALAGIAVLVTLLAGVTAIGQVILILFLVGWLVSPLNAAAMTILQTSVAGNARGRVSAALNAIMSAASIASMAAAGLLGAAIGVQNVFVVAGLVTAGSAVLAFILFRRVASSSRATDRSGQPVTLGDPHWDPE